MDKLLAHLEAGRIARIVVWLLDRLGRTAKGRCSLFDDLRARSGALVSIKDGFSLNTPAGRLHARILASVAEYETEVRAERVSAGQIAARAAGKTWGGSKPGRLLKVTPEQREAILQADVKGVPIARTAKTLGLSRPTIYRVLKNAKNALQPLG